MSVELSRREERRLKELLIRAFTKKQLVILKSVSEDKSRSITSVAKKISETSKIPLSTVKFDLALFERLGLIRIGEKDGFKRPSMTRFGKLILQIIYNNLKPFDMLLDKLSYLFPFI